MTYTNADIVPAALYGKDAETRTGTFSARRYPRAMSLYFGSRFGALPQRLCDILRDRLAAGAISQVIYSYSTPIAWKDGDTWIIPDVVYSTTTSTRHQTHLYRLRGEYIPWDAGMDEYMQVLNGHARYIRPQRRSAPGTYVARRAA